MNSGRTILRLDYDALKAILLLVVASAGGATDLAKIMAVCKVFAMFSDEKDLLAMANFENFSFPDSIEGCQHVNSLLIRCAEAGNVSAQHILAKVILIGYSQLLDQESNHNKRLRTCLHTDQASSSRNVERDTLFSFLSYFTPEQENSDGRRFTHFKLVSLFLRRCSIVDHVSMLPHVQNYMDHFAVAVGKNECMKFYHNFNSMSSFLRAIVDVGRRRRTWHSPRLLNNSQLEPEMRNAGYVLRSLDIKLDYYFFSRSRVLSQPKWEELKRECKFIDEELLSCAKQSCRPKFLDMGKRIFYYLAFSGPVTQEITVPWSLNVVTLHERIIQYAKAYNAWQQEAASVFDEMFLLKD